MAGVVLMLGLRLAGGATMLSIKFGMEWARKLKQNRATIGPTPEEKH